MQSGSTNTPTSLRDTLVRLGRHRILPPQSSHERLLRMALPLADTREGAQNAVITSCKRVTWMGICQELPVAEERVSSVVSADAAATTPACC